MAAAEFEICDNCARPIPVANLPLHVAHCETRLVRCDGCDEMVASAAMDQHIAAVHAPAPCSLCGEPMERRLLAEHEASACPLRSMICAYCDLPVTAMDLQSHTDVCGSRTDQCEICNKYVRKREQEAHQQQHIMQQPSLHAATPSTSRDNTRAHSSHSSREPCSVSNGLSGRLPGSAARGGASGGGGGSGGIGRFCYLSSSVKKSTSQPFNHCPSAMYAVSRQSLSATQCAAHIPRRAWPPLAALRCDKNLAKPLVGVAKSSHGSSSAFRSSQSLLRTAVLTRICGWTRSGTAAGECLMTREKTAVLASNHGDNGASDYSGTDATNGSSNATSDVISGSSKQASAVSAHPASSPSVGSTPEASFLGPVGEMLQRNKAKTAEVLEKLKSFGVAGVLAYGLFNTVYYIFAFLFVFTRNRPPSSTLLPLPTPLSLHSFLKVFAVLWAGSQVTKLVRAVYFEALEKETLCVVFPSFPNPDPPSLSLHSFLKVFAVVWAGSQVTKLLRAGGALMLAPLMERGIVSLSSSKGLFRSRGQAVAAIVAFCFGLAGILFLAVTALWA
ncbi:unnamed protein product [Closterium sp. NIES-53]